MHIDSVELYLVSMPLLYPWRTAYGEDSTIDSILVRMRSGEHSAWAESSPLAAPCYSPEWAVSAFALLEKWLAPAIVGQWVGSGEELQQKLSHFKGNQFAKAALDNAWWVLKAQSTGQPLYKLLGGTRDRFDVGADFGIMDNVGDLLDGVGKALAEGFPRVKLKFRPGWDVNMLRAIRREFPTQTFHIDCNSGYRLNEHLELFCRLDDFFLAMIEQPLAYDDVVDHARLQETIGTAICLDESINSVHRAEQAIELGSCRYINIKPARVGGLTNALAIHNLCREAGVPCWVGGMLESAVGASICIALATLDNFTYPADIFPSSRFYADDLGEPAITLTKSAAGVPQAVASSEPGIGAAPNMQRLERLCLKKVVIG